MGDRCTQCGGRIVRVDTNKIRGIVGKTMEWIHTEPRRNANHKAAPKEGR